MRFAYLRQLSGSSLKSPKQANTIAINNTIDATTINDTKIEDIRKYLHTNLKIKVSTMNGGKKKQIKNLWIPNSPRLKK